MPDIGLTEAQKKEIEAISKDAMAEAKEAKPEARKAIFEKMRKAIQSVFTEEQLEKLKKARRRQGPQGRRSSPGQEAACRRMTGIQMRKRH